MMEFTIAFLLFLVINLIFIPFESLLPKRNLKKLVGHIHDQELKSPLISATNIMEKIFSFSEKYYPLIKNSFHYDIYRKYAKNIVISGLGDRVTPEGILASKFIIAIFLMAYLFFMGFLAPIFMVLSPIAAILGYIYPDQFLKTLIQKRQWEIQKELPNVLNTLAIITEAGLGLFESIEKVCEIRDGVFIKELRKVNEEIKVGVLRKDAFIRMSERCQVNEVSSFVSALLQLLEKGSSGIAKFLKESSSELWDKRINMAREIGAKASLKLFLPMLLLVLPATMIFLAGPIVVKIIAQFF